MATTADQSPESLSLCSLRSRLEALADSDGAFVVAAADAGVRPVPVAGLRFDSLDAAREAARLAETYRSALRRYDPQLPRYDVVARRDPSSRR
ncbi:DUF7552 domain-containing protein [Halorubellus salinus]|uniref:DUF7552 domain-containing protein n=1 Tax=Halorubellus salinus TaxID=755309 RepID=UPI001D0762A4|nr:hypothetical protein [Halorubellus salinus]